MRSSALQLRKQGRYAEAVSVYDTMLARDTTTPADFNGRGFAYAQLGEYDRAIADFGRALALRPDYGQAAINRGRIFFYLGRFREAITDMERALPKDSTNAYVPLWLYLAKRRAGEGDTTELARQLRVTDTVAWPAPVGKYYLGRISRDSMIHASLAVDPRVKHDQRCAASFFLAQEAMFKHDSSVARTLFTEARDGCPHDWTEYRSAVKEVERLTPRAR